MAKSKVIKLSGAMLKKKSKEVMACCDISPVAMFFIQESFKPGLFVHLFPMFWMICTFLPFSPPLRNWRVEVIRCCSFGQIHFAIQTNTECTLDKYCVQFLQKMYLQISPLHFIYFAIQTNTFCSLHISILFPRLWCNWRREAIRCCSSIYSSSPHPLPIHYKSYILPHKTL